MIATKLLKHPTFEKGCERNICEPRLIAHNLTKMLTVEDIEMLENDDKYE